MSSNPFTPSSNKGPLQPSLFSIPKASLFSIPLCSSSLPSHTKKLNKEQDILTLEWRWSELSRGKDRAGIHTLTTRSRFVSSTIIEGIEEQSTKNLMLGLVSAPRTEEGWTACCGFCFKDDKGGRNRWHHRRRRRKWVTIEWRTLEVLRLRGEVEKFGLVKLGFGVSGVKRGRVVGLVHK